MNWPIPCNEDNVSCKKKNLDSRAGVSGTWDEKAIHGWWEFAHEISKSGHCRILRKYAKLEIGIGWCPVHR